MNARALYYTYGMRLIKTIKINKIKITERNNTAS